MNSRTFSPVLFSLDKVVAQVGNLLYRRLAACGRLNYRGATMIATPSRLPIGDTAGCQPALRRDEDALESALFAPKYNIVE
jgi:hypothetical protein